ncbi:cytidine deaminase [Pleurocapsa sp. CCALA 161]|uniref:cytidine deaminase n=1 Tax=Pleurocapsa sp. CCALA 161 TaxID=2107688 RepID=UPI000D06EBD7|nr:cytidine deaminase [Pleurocapsa sp. CCALA 161]PSB11863.1 cytidine deaminase [Pleurocapsa sp. CCALA 161]
MTSAELIKSGQERLIESATQAINSAYAPYSQFKVGAAVLTSTGEIFAGCNVENASYGLSMCAERNAIANAIIGSAQDTITIKAIAVANSHNVSCSPCGACRQVIWEFGQNAQVIFRGNQGWQTSTIKDLLPEGFSL